MTNKTNAPAVQFRARRQCYVIGIKPGPFVAYADAANVSGRFTRHLDAHLAGAVRLISVGNGVYNGLLETKPGIKDLAVVNPAVLKQSIQCILYRVS